MAMRERTPFPRALLERLPAAAPAGHHRGCATPPSTWRRRRERGITVCGTAGLPCPTAELTWGLILALCRRIPVEDRADARRPLADHRRARPHGRDPGRARAGAAGVAGGPVRPGLRDGRAGLEPEPHRRAGGGGGVHGRWTRTSCSRARTWCAFTSCWATGPVAWSAPRELARMKPHARTSSTPRAARSSTRRRWSGRCGEGTIAGAGAGRVRRRSRCRPTTRCATLPNTVLTPHLGYVTHERYEVFYGDAVEDVHAFRRGAPVRLLN